MAEVAAESAVATSEAPVVETATEVVEAPVVESEVTETSETSVADEAEKPKGPRTMKEVEALVREKARQRREARDKKAAEEAPVEEQVEEPVTDEVPEETPSDVSETTEPEADQGQKEGEEKPADGPQPVVVPIDPRHPASQGQSELKFADEMSARVFKAYKNSNVKQSQIELEQAQTALAQAKEELNTLHDRNDRTEADQVAWKKWQGSQEGQAALKRYNDLLQREQDGDIEPGTAADYWAGASLRYKDTANAEYETRVKERTAKTEAEQKVEQQKATERWIAEAAENQKYLGDTLLAHPQYEKWFNDALVTFDHKLQTGQIGGIKSGDPASAHAAFNKFFRAELFHHEAAMAAMRGNTAQKQKQEQEAVAARAAEQKRLEKIKQDAIEEYKANLANRRSDVPRPNPIGNLAGAARDRAPVSSGGEEPDLSTMTPHNRERYHEERVRQKARARMGRA